MVVVAGCGGGGASAERVVRGTGYTFAAPAGWTLVRSDRQVRVSDGVNVVSVTRFPLLRTYRPELWTQVLRELDRAADGIAEQQNGSVTARVDETIAGRRARRYDVAYEHDGRHLVERIGFVLRGKTEYLLLCRYERDGDTAACDRLFSAFRLEQEA